MLKENASIDDVEDLKINPTIKDLFLHTAGFSYNFLADPIGRKYDEVKLFHSDTTTLEEEIKKLAEILRLIEKGYLLEQMMEKKLKKMLLLDLEHMLIQPKNQ